MSSRSVTLIIAVVLGPLTATSSFADAHHVAFNEVIASVAQANNTSNQTDTETGANNASKVVGPVSAPKLIHTVEPKFSKVARKSGIDGTVLVNLFIEKDGSTSNVHAIRINRAVKNGYEVLDPDSDDATKDLAKAAVDAVSQYRFKPAKQNGQQVKVVLNIEVPIQY
jgi:outer membrane biosynthesis protein TonB